MFLYNVYSYYGFMVNMHHQLQCHVDCWVRAALKPISSSSENVLYCTFTYLCKRLNVDVADEVDTC